MLLENRSIRRMHTTYQCLLIDVARYHYLIAEGFCTPPSSEPLLPPAAEEALRDLTARAVSDLEIPHWIAREGLLYAAQMHAAPASHTFLQVAAQLHLQEQREVVDA